jgi:hypothetical protein
MTQIRDQLFLAGQVAQATADNATATATATPHTGDHGHKGRLTLLGFSADYTATVAAINTITIGYTDNDDAARTLVYSWDFTAGGVTMAFPGPIACKPGTVATAALTDSGTGGVSGSVKLHYAES